MRAWACDCSHLYSTLPNPNVNSQHSGVLECKSFFSAQLLLTHFFLSLQSLIDDIINSINNLIYQAISSLESGLLSTPPERLGFSHANHPGTIPDTDADGNVEYPEARLEIENGLHQLETLFEANVDKAFDKFEIYVLRNILIVPGDLQNWLRLGHYEVSFGHLC
jgi:kinetochore protein Mis12/MTW1